MTLERARDTAHPDQTGAHRTDFARPVHCLLGLPIDAVSMAEAIARIRSATATRSPCWVSTSNSQFLGAARSDKQFRDSIILSELSLADGKPLIWMARLLGLPIRERVAGSDLFDALIRGDGGALKVFFFGGPDGVAEMACRRINSLASPLTCVGYVSPGFGTLEEISRPELIEQINRSEADFLVVALGAMKGQGWIARNRSVLKVPVVSHLGAVVNFVAGTVERAPVWMRKVGLEWMWRIREEPHLWQRYWNDCKRLVPLVLNRVVLRVAYRALDLLAGSRTPASADLSPAGSASARATLSGSWSEKDIPSLQNMFGKLALRQQDIELEVSRVERVNDVFIAQLLLLYGHQLRNGKALTLLSPGRTLRRSIKLYCAEFLLGQNGAEPR